MSTVLRELKQQHSFEGFLHYASELKPALTRRQLLSFYRHSLEHVTAVAGCIIETTQGKRVGAGVNDRQTSVALTRSPWIISMVHAASERWLYSRDMMPM
ncbi:hypothetical protein Y032_0201g1749 [Ancylostoma ceylanicum]|uniref:Uncharacterized protein n=1 Tax=Ancylostoma ceylanicum TaxID=53326 RepID=A0A016SMD4_9BILA|nr:hypothetical protein Y032_0201g1749 [Ancylostoma ceylanicum]